jgi:hypothetical protein
MLTVLKLSWSTDYKGVTSSFSGSLAGAFTGSFSGSFADSLAGAFTGSFAGSYADSFEGILWADWLVGSLSVLQAVMLTVLKASFGQFCRCFHWQ